jgi:hypothetical protein
MARDTRVESFVKMVERAVNETSSVMTVFEAMRLFGYITETQYSDFNTTWMRLTKAPSVRSDGAETIELARRPNLPEDPEDILPSIY